MCVDFFFMGLPPCFLQGALSSAPPAAQDGPFHCLLSGKRPGSSVIKWALVSHTLSSTVPPTSPPLASRDTDFPDLSGVPACYRDLKEVFNKARATSLSPHHLNNCCITLLPGSSPPRGLLYSTHIQHVRQVLQCLLDHQLFVKAENCEFHFPTVSCLGFVVLGDTVQMNPAVIGVVGWSLCNGSWGLQIFTD